MVAAIARAIRGRALSCLDLVAVEDDSGDLYTWYWNPFGT